MLGILLITVLPTWILIRAIENRVVKVLERPLERWKRYLIPLPLAVLLGGNWLEVTQLNETATWIVRPDRAGGPLDWGFGIALGMMICVPFILLWTEREPWEKFWGACAIWTGYFIWLFCPFYFVLLATGMPWQR